ncbi:hypothetical protein PSYMO_39075, partial [Pseudomonas amygdali pv. mori str. 301020]
RASFSQKKHVLQFQGRHDPAITQRAGISFLRGVVARQGEIALAIWLYIPATDLPGFVLATHIDGNHKSLKQA